jgi:putative secretion ATPase (PEP-CTERM system associated)
MYERFYNLHERPFSLSPDPDYLYPSRAHTEALHYLRYGLEGHAGFVVITGDIGSGKTTLLQMMLRGIDRRTSVARLVSTMLDARELIEAVMLDFGLDPAADRSKPHLLRDLARFLVDQRRAGRLSLLIIDEAQNLSPAALEEVRMLSNLETEKSKLIQIVLVGQPNLQHTLGRPEFEQLRQRVTVRYHLRPLEPSETAAYINHRLRRAAIGAPLVFSREVTDLIERSSQGVPRKINVIADAVLLFGYGEDQRTIDAALVRSVIAELEATAVIDAPGPARVESARPAPAPVATPGVLASVAVPSADPARIEPGERQLADHQQILTEHPRVLHPRESSAAAVPIVRASVPAPPGPAPSRDANLTATPLFAATFHVREESAPLARARNHRHHAGGPGVWTRLRRGLFGVGKPLLED